MATIFFTSNIASLTRTLRDDLAAFGFDSPGDGGAASVGDAVRIMNAAAIFDRSQAGVDPDGHAWDANSDDPEGHGYASRKREELGHAQPNVYTGQMLSQPSIQGELRNGHHESNHVYGTGVRAIDHTGRVNPTDRNRAQWAHEQNRFTGVTRPFFGITEADADAAAEMVANSLIAELAAKYR